MLDGKPLRFATDSGKSAAHRRWKRIVSAASLIGSYVGGPTALDFAGPGLQNQAASLRALAEPKRAANDAPRLPYRGAEGRAEGLEGLRFGRRMRAS